MQNKQKNILIFVLALAGLLVGMLYTPIVSPDLYYSTAFYPQNNNIVMNGGQIPNAPKSQPIEENTEIIVPDYNNAEIGLSGKSGSSNYSQSSGISSDGSYQADNNASQMYSPVSGSASNNGASMAGYMASGSSRSNSASSSIQMSNGVVTVSSDLATNTTAPKENTLSGPSAGGTDPGGDPTGPPIPVGDGWIFLLVLASGYVLFKKSMSK